MALHIGAHYYRPPFPRSDLWQQDLHEMKAAGLDTVQLWLVWGWIEPAPGEFRFADYDRIIELAGAAGLKVILSTVAEVQPNWIHRIAAGSEMITNQGLRVVSTSRRESHAGITPGGCIDHPEVWRLMARFLDTVTRRYSSVQHLAGWDVWNELRWNVHSEGLVCYCDHTLSRFRSWLDAKHGGLDGLNHDWERRYTAWEDVLPGKRPGRVYTEMMAFEQFITWRSVEHAVHRYDIVKGIDPGHPVTVHGGKPTVLYGDDSYWKEGEPSTVLHRGNDWYFADRIDGVGCSSFPIWENIDHADFIARIDYVRSARGTKRLWLSEVQGGRSASGYTSQRPVDAASQQRWLWSGLAAGADTILFWCWRDEIFGHESGGFGISGKDGRAAERIAAFRKTGEILAAHGNTIEHFVPEKEQVGVFFSPQSYYQNWAQDGDAVRTMNALQGYVRALVRSSIPYVVVEENHLEVLDSLRVLFMPRVLVMDSRVTDALARFVSRGGTLVAESEQGAYGENGVYRESTERWLAAFAGIADVGRRELTGSTVTVEIDGTRYRLPATQWLTPFANGESGARAQEQPVASREVKGGRVIALGLYAGEAYYRGSRAGAEQFTPFASEFERFVADRVSTAGVQVALRVESPSEAGVTHVRWGISGGVPVIYAVSDTPRSRPVLIVNEQLFHACYRDIISGTMIEPEHQFDGITRLTLPQSDWGVWCLFAGSQEPL